MRSAAAAFAWEFQKRLRWGLIALAVYLVVLAAVQFLVLGAVFIAVGFPVDASAGLLAGSLASTLFRAGSKVRRRLERVCAGIFTALAARLAADIH